MANSLLADAAKNFARWREAPQLMVRELFATTPDAWQDDALAAFPKSPRLCMRACKGPGKGFRLSMEFETPAGRMRWGNLEPGSQVFGPDGSICSVTRTFPLGIQPLYRVSFDDGTYCDVTGEHLWKVRGRTERRHFKSYQAGTWTKNSEIQCLAKGFVPTPRDGYSILTTEQIIERNRLPDGQRGRQFEIPTQGPAQFPRAEQPLDPYVVGVWLGDGSRAEPCYNKPHTEIEDEIRARGYPTTRDAGDRVRLLKSKPDFRRALGDVFDAGSHKRKIPVAYKYASIDQRRDLLCGLMDTDGCIGDDGHMEYSTTSRQLAEDVVWIVRSLGGVSLIKAAIKKGWYRDDDGRKVECRDCCRVTVTLPFNPFRIAHKRRRWHLPQQRYLTRYISGIERIGDDEAMCIEVDHPSRCHLANDFVVTHNTAVLAWLAYNFLLTRPHPIIGATSVTGDNLKSNLWTELARWREKSEILKSFFDQTGTKVFARDHPDTWKLEARTWAKDADAEAIGNALSGLHADYVMWLLDESGDYPDAILPTVEAIFAGSPIEAHVVQAGNPIKTSGPLYRACTSARHLWKVVEITGDPDDPKRSPRISIEHAREQIALYGRDNPWVMINILGQFPSQSLNALIGPDEVRASMARMYREYDLAGMAKAIGADVARQGDDMSVIAKRHGLQMFPFVKLRNVTGLQGAAVLVREWDEFGADAAFVDATGGFGWPWIEQARVLGKQPIPVEFAGKAHDIKRYVNKRAEMAFDLVEWIRRGGALPQDERLLAQLTETTYTHKGDRLIIEPKEQLKARLGYSPDEMDSSMITLAEPIAAASRRRPANRSAVDPSYDPFAAPVTGPGQAYDPFGR